MQKIFTIFKYLLLPILFFAVEVMTHGNEYIPLLLIVILSIALYIRSKNRETEVVLYGTGFLLGTFIEIGLTNLDRVQVWENSNLLSIPLWLPFAWGVGAVLFYKLGKDLEKNNMQNSNQKCEMCSMQATHTEVDTRNTTHYFCEHHSLTKTNPHLNVISSSKDNSKKLLPLFVVIAAILLLSGMRQFTNGVDFVTWMMDFMGIFFITFGLFKLYDLKGFVEGFKTYDILAKRFIVFGYAFPFIEILLGVMYLAGFMFLWQNIVALVLSALGIYSAYAVIKRKEEIQCVCLGTFFNLPMTHVTVIENGVMFVMVLFMLLM